MDIARAPVAVEKSRSWPMRLAGQIPPYVDVFCLVGIDPQSERFVGWGYYESTTEMPGWGARCRGNVVVLAQVTVPLDARTESCLKEALRKATLLLDQTIWKSPASEYVAFRNKLAEDLTFWRSQSEVGGVVIERVDQSTFDAILRGEERA